MKTCPRPQLTPWLGAALLAILVAVPAAAHGTVVSPISRVYRVYQANPSNPSFTLAANAVAIDGELSYYTWNEVSRNIPEAVVAGLPPGFDYSPWLPDGQIASAGRVDPASTEYPRTYAGLDQVSVDWPKTPVVGGSTITVDFLATAPHDPSVWDVWMTTPGWDPATPMTWAELEFLGRPTVTLTGNHYTFDQGMPSNRSGHHVLLVAWHRDDPVGEVFFSASDIDIAQPFQLAMASTGFGDLTFEVSGIPSGAVQGFTVFSLATSSPVGTGPLFGIVPDALSAMSFASPAAAGNPLHFLAPFGAGSYPNGAYQLPPGSLPGVVGLRMDGLVGVLDASSSLIDVTNVARVTL